MSFLKNAPLSAAISLILLALFGCDKGSPSYKTIEKLPYSEWNRYAASLPVDQRLDLQKEIISRSGHNPIMTISESFTADPEQTYHALIKRIKAGDKSRYYLSVIYSISRNKDFDICRQRERIIIQRYLWGMATKEVRYDDRPVFYRC